jgi:ubiquinone/menaquinone biosynthesis C-methylase UbiE
MRLATLMIVVLGCALALTAPTNARQQGQAGANAQHPDHMEHSFADVERYAKTFDDPGRDAWQVPDRVIAALGLKPGDSIADIGAGTGYFTVRLAKSPAAPKVYAADIEPAMVEYLHHRAMREGLKNIVPILAAGDRANLPEPVNAVFIVDTYHHIANRVAYFTTLKKSFKPGGRLAIVDFKKGAPDGPPEEFRFTPEQITAELGKAGYTLQTQHDFLPRQMFLIYRTN